MNQPMKYEEKREALKRRFQEVSERAQYDRDTLEKIRDRSLWQKLFSNSTRDLARASISQNEILSELFSAVQDVLELTRENTKRAADFRVELEKIIRDVTEQNDRYREDFLYLFREIWEHDEEIRELDFRSGDQGIRIATMEQTGRVCTDIGLAAQKYGPDSARCFLEICRAVCRHFGESALPNACKEAVLEKVGDLGFAPLDAGALNRDNFRKGLTELFAGKVTGEGARGKWGRYLLGESPLPDSGPVPLKDAAEGVLDAAFRMESEIYSKFRGRLIGILDDFLKKDIGIEPNDAEKLGKIKNRLVENQFEIALVGEFQGGKSTTFNVLCGGREISPRGLNGGGIKTSAAIISAQNIAGDEQREGLSEWAEIQWLPRKEIVSRIARVLEKYDWEEPRKIQFGKEEETPIPALRELMDRAWERNAVEAGRTEAGGKDGKDDEAGRAEAGDQEAEDLLRIAELQLRLLEPSSKGAFETATKETVLSVGKFQELVQFPAKWESRWEKKRNADFFPDECLFTAIDRVLVKIHSDALKRLGCKITDCPGLFVSEWDTDQAKAVMHHSNAIWYLLGGEKEYGQGDARILKEITEEELSDRSFFTLNWRKGGSQTERIYESDRSKLKGAGFRPEGRLFQYDAFLSFRAAQLARVDAMSEKDLECLAAESPLKEHKEMERREVVRALGDRETRLKALKRMIGKHLVVLDLDDLSEALQGTDDAESLLADLNAAAGIHEVLNAIEKWIITKKAHSIFIDEGTKKCLGVLKHISAVLTQREEAAKQTLEEAKKEAEQARSTLNDFLKNCKEKFDFLNDAVGEIKSDDGLDGEAETAGKPSIHLHPLDIAMREQFFETQITTEFRETMKKSAVAICKDVWHHGGHLGQKTVNRDVETRIQNKFKKELKDRLSKFHRHMKENYVFQTLIGEKLKRGLKEMTQKWEKLSIGPIFESVKMPGEDDVSDDVSADFNQDIEGKIETPLYFWEFLKKVGLYMIGIGFYYKHKGIDITDRRIDKFFEENDPVGKAFDTFKGNSENNHIIADYLGSYRRGYVAALKKGFAEMEGRLQRNIEERMKIVTKNNVAKEEAAADAKKRREEVIEPYTRKIERFEKEVERFYVKQA